MSKQDKQLLWFAAAIVALILIIGKFAAKPGYPAGFVGPIPG